VKRIAALALPLVLLLAASAHAQGWLGVRIRDLSELEMDEISARHGIREGYGVVIVAVLEDSPAARSAIRAGDIVVGFAGRPIVDSRTFQRVVGGAPLDREIPLTVLRNEGRRQLMVRLAPMPVEIAGERVAAELGFALREVDAEKLGDKWLGSARPSGVASSPATCCGGSTTSPCSPSATRPSSSPVCPAASRSGWWCAGATRASSP